MNSLDVLQDTTAIEFHTSKLKLGHAKLASSSLAEPFVQEALSLKHNEEEERAILELPMTLPAGTKAELKIDFEGELTGAMMGYYCSAWEHEGKTAYYSLTQFEVRTCRVQRNPVFTNAFLSLLLPDALSPAGTSLPSRPLSASR